MTFPAPTTNETANLFKIFKFINNTATDGLFFPIILLVIWTVAFIVSLSHGRVANVSFVFASFISFILSIILALMGFLAPQYIYLLSIFLAFGLVWMKLQNAPLN